MKTVIISTILSLVTSLAQADGFKCTSQSGLNFQVYNHVQPQAGTRSAAALVISNSAVGYGRKVIAVFRADQGTLKSVTGRNLGLESPEVVHYVGQVDSSVSGLDRTGELIAGTKLGFVQTIDLAVHFSFTKPLVQGEKTSARLVIAKTNGAQIVEAVACVRYLKN